VKPESPFTVGPQRLAAVAPVAERGPGFSIRPRANSHREAPSYDLNLWTERDASKSWYFIPDSSN